MLLKNVYSAQIKNIEDKIPGITNLAIKTSLNAKINEAKGEIPNITNLAKTNDVKSKILIIANFIKTADHRPTNQSPLTHRPTDQLLTDPAIGRFQLVLK